MTVPLLLTMLGLSWSGHGATDAAVRFSCVIEPTAGIALELEDHGQGAYVVDVGAYRTGADAMMASRRFLSVGRPAVFAALGAELVVNLEGAPLVVALAEVANARR